jgi:PAS domain S-box-containing protein
MTTGFKIGAAAAAASAAYQAERRRRFMARAPWAFAVPAVCAAMTTVFEMLRFPERQSWALAAGAAFVVIPAVALALVRAFPQRPIWIGIGAANLLGLVLSAYHAIVGAQIATSIWTLTALLGAAPILLTWGWRAQALASVGVVIGYPLLLGGDTATILTWAAGGVYLCWVVGLSVLAAALIDGYLATDFALASALSERESRLQSYFDLSLVGTAILSRDRRLLEVNEELSRMLGYAPAELLRVTWSDLVPACDREPDAALFDAVLRGERAAGVREGALLRRDAAQIHAIISMRGLPGPLGPADHLILVVQDMTERLRADSEREDALVRERSARREAEAASRAMDEFLAMASHELRSPLTPILGWTRLLRAGGLSAERQGRALEAIERSSRSLSQLIDDLLDVSAIASGKLRLAPRPTEMGPIVRAAAESLRPAAEAKGVRLTTRLGDGHARVLGDPGRLQQVVWNLVSNAIKFTEPGGDVDVDVVRREGHVETRVRDTGKGLEAEWLPHVFERFWQADVTTTRRYDGLGLGLAIVRHLVELHEGTVEVESAGPGKGASFSVRLSLTTEPAAQERAPRTQLPRRLEGVRVLVVDDKADAQEIARMALEQSGVEVRTAGSAREALEILATWTPTLLVSDIAMPDEDGYALVRHLRAHETAHGGHVPALAFTALARAEDRARVLAAGFDGYVSKPVDPLQLVDAVANALDGTVSEASSDGPDAAPAAARVRRESMPPTPPSQR